MCYTLKQTKWILLGLLFLLTYRSSAQSIQLQQLQFKSSNAVLSSGTWTLQDSTWIGLDTGTFKSLLFTTARVQFDTLSGTDSLRIQGPFLLMARIGNGQFQPLWQYDSLKTLRIKVSDLLADSGYRINQARQLSVEGIPFLPSAFQLHQDTSSGNSQVRLRGTFLMPETGDAVRYTLNDSQRVVLNDTGNFAPDFLARVDTTFLFKKSGYIGKNLFLRHDISTRSFSMYGNLTFVIDSNFIPAQLGDSLNPGLVYANGQVDRIRLIANDSFRLFRLKLEPRQLVMNYQRSDSSYNIYGELDLSVEQTSIKLQLGDSANPGCVAQNNRILQFRASVPDTFQLKQLTLKPQQLQFQLDTNGTGGSNRYFLFGNLTAVLKTDSIGTRDSIIATLGDSIQPGMEIENGELKQFNLSVSSNFKLKGLELQPDSLGFSYVKDDQHYAIYGRMGIRFDSVEYHLQAGNLGSPGIIISQGQLLQLEVSVDDTIKVRGFQLKPENLTFRYDTTSGSRFELYGAATAIIRGDSLSKADTIYCQLGDSSSPGMLVEGGKLQHLELGVSGKFKLKGLELEPDSFTFAWDGPNKWMEMYGKLGVNVDSMNFKASLGDATTPGIIFSADKLVQLRFTIEDTIHVKGTRFKPDPLTFAYDTAANNRFRLWGNMVALLKGDSVGRTDTIYCEAGTETLPGVTVQNGALQTLNLQVKGAFRLKQLYLEPNPLTLQYDGTEKRYELFGDMRLALESDTLELGLGNDSLPGALIANGDLQSLNVSVTDTIKIKSLQLAPKGLTFRYRSTDSRYVLFGGLSVLVEGDTIRGTLGTESLPGLVVSRGQIQDININVRKTKFTLKGIGLESDSITFRYDRSNDYYELFGDVALDFDSNKLAVGLGDDANPGIVIQNGELSHIRFEISDTFKLRGLIFHPDSMGFAYDRDSNYYEIFGKAAAVIKGDSIVLGLGDELVPGIKVQNGTLEDINLSISADFKMKGMEIHPRGLDFYYSKSRKRFEIFGALDLRFEGNTLDMEMGTLSSPGLVINTSTGDLEAMDMSTTDTFKLYSMILRPKNLTFQYNKDSASFEMYGSLMAALGSDSVLLDLGSVSNPGFRFANKQLQHLNFGITDSMRLYGLLMQTTGLTCEYDRGRKLYEVYGGINLAFSGEQMKAKLGDANKPGIEIINSRVEEINIGVDGDFNILGMKFQPKDLTFEYDHLSAHYEMYGSLGFNLEGEAITASLGDSVAPGFTIKNGVLVEMNIAITSDIKMGGLEVATQNMGVYYTKADASNPKDRYIIHGTAFVKELWSIAASLGDPNVRTSGLEILVDPATGHTNIKLDAFSFEAKHVDFGGVNFNDIKVAYKTDPGGGYTIEGDLDVSFPAGFEVSGGLVMSKKGSTITLDSIGIMYQAQGADPGIEIPETGIFIVEMGGGVKKIGAASTDYQFFGSIGLVMGGQVTILGNSYTMLRIDGNVVVDKNHLYMKDDVYCAAYGNMTDGFNGVLGSGEVILELDWMTGDYTLDGTISYYSIVEFKSEVEYHTNGTMGALGEASLIIPKWIPVIGGKKLASVDAAIRYNKHVMNQSFAAGWARFNLVVKKVTAGVEYNFGTQEVKKIGQDDVDNLKSEVNSDAQNDNFDYTFTVDKYVKAVTVAIRVADTADKTTLRELITVMSLPLLHNTMELITPVAFFGHYDIGALIRQTYFNNGSGTFANPYYAVTLDTLMSNAIVFHFTGPNIDEDEVMEPGLYGISTIFPKAVGKLLTVDIQQHYLSPEGGVDAKMNAATGDIDMRVVARYYYSDTAIATVYMTEDPHTKNGRPIETIYLPVIHKAQDLNYSFSFDPPRDTVILSYDANNKPLLRRPVQRRHEYYFYVVFNDGVNEPTYSPLSNGVWVEPRAVIEPLPQDININYVGKKVQASMEFGFDLQYDPKDREQYQVSVFYDQDNVGNNGFPIDSLQNLSIDDIENADSAFYFSIDDLTRTPYAPTYYFYTRVFNQRTQEVTFSPYSAPVVFRAPVQLALTYASLQHHRNSPASGVKAWLDMNNNGKYDVGIDEVKLSNGQGFCGFFIPASGTYTLGVLNAQDSSIYTTSLNCTLGKTSFLQVSIPYPPVTVAGTMLLRNRINGNVVNPALYTGHGTGNNYIFLDYNDNGIWDQNLEPRSMDSGSGQFSFQATQQEFNIIYEDVVGYTSDSRMRLQEGSWTVNGKLIQQSNSQQRSNLLIDLRNQPMDLSTIKFEGLIDLK